MDATTYSSLGGERFTEVSGTALKKAGEDTRLNIYRSWQSTNTMHAGLAI
jgi:hypothetical protein